MWFQSERASLIPTPSVLLDRGEARDADTNLTFRFSECLPLPSLLSYVPTPALTPSLTHALTAALTPTLTDALTPALTSVLTPAFTPSPTSPPPTASTVALHPSLTAASRLPHPFTSTEALCIGCDCVFPLNLIIQSARERGRGQGVIQQHV